MLIYRVMNLKAAILSLISCAAGFVLPAAAENHQPPSVDDVVEIDVLPGWRDASGKHIAALRIRLDKGWKTYWRAPGEAGIPPSLNWKESDNIAGVEFHWPVPDVFDTAGVQTIGYSNELVLPMTLTPRADGQPIVLEGNVNLGVCQDVCIPMDTRISVTLPVDGGGSKAQIKQALRQRPDTANEAGLKSATCDVEPISDGLRLRAKIEMPRVGQDEVVVIETADPSIWASEVSSMRDHGALVAVFELFAASGKPFVLDRSDIRLTVLAAGRGVDIHGCTGG